MADIQKPSVGRIVHFHETPESPPRAAIVTRVWSDTMVNLYVPDADAGPALPMTSVSMTGAVAGLREWRWPPRV